MLFWSPTSYIGRIYRDGRLERLYENGVPLFFYLDLQITDLQRQLEIRFIETARYEQEPPLKIETTL